MVIVATSLCVRVLFFPMLQIQVWSTVASKSALISPTKKFAIALSLVPGSITTEQAKLSFTVVEIDLDLPVVRVWANEKLKLCVADPTMKSSVTEKLAPTFHVKELAHVLVTVLCVVFENEKPHDWDDPGAASQASHTSFECAAFRDPSLKEVVAQPPPVTGLLHFSPSMVEGPGMHFGSTNETFS